MSESGLEVARAYLSVLPETSDFPSALDEQVGGLALSVVVTPNASDFASAFDEAVGGLSLTVPVTADASDFEASFLEQVGSLTVPVTVTAEAAGAANLSDAVSEQAGTIALPVSLLPEVSDFGAVLEERLGDLTVPVSVYPDTTADDFQSQLDDRIGTPVVGVDLQASVANMAEHLADSLTGAVPVPVVPNVGDFTDAVTEETGGITVSADVIPSASSLAGFGAKVTEGVGQPVVTVSVQGDTGPILEEIQDLRDELSALGDDSFTPALASVTQLPSALGNVTAAEADASAGAETLADDLARLDDVPVGALQEQLGEIQQTFAEMGAELDYLDGRFGALSGGIVSTSEETASAAGVLDSLNSQFAAVGGELASFEAEMSAAGASAEGNAQQLSLLSSMVSELEGNLAAGDDAIDGWASGLAQARAAATGAAEPVDLVAKSAADLSDAAPAASDAASGLSGVIGELAGRLSYFAVDPFMWMYAAPVVIEGVTDALRGLSTESDSLVASVEKQNDATGYNISGYQAAAAALSQYSDAAQKAYDSNQILGSRGGGQGAVLAQSHAMSEAAQQEMADADNLSGHLGTLEDAYGMTATQAETLATAAGVSYKTMESSGDAADKAMASIANYAAENLTASTAVSQLTQDQAIFSSAAFTATDRVNDMDNAFQTLVGNFVSVQTAQLNVTGGFDNLEAATQAAGASMTGTNTQSVGLQQSFFAMAGTIEQAANAMVQQGDSAQTVTGYIGDQITALSKYEGGSKDASLAVQDLKRWEDSLTGSLETQGNYLATTLDDDLDNAILKYSGVQTAVNDYANALVDFGKNSPQAQNAQTLLTNAIVKGGLAAGQSTTQIAQMIAAMEKIPLKEAIQIVLNAEGKYTVSGVNIVAPGTAAVQGGGQLVRSTAGLAGGGLVTGGSGHPRADDIPALLSHGEYVVSAGSVSKYGTGFLDSVNAGHFADGGSVTGSYSGDAAGMGAWLGAQYDTTNAMLVQAVEAAMAATVAAAQGDGSSRAPIIVQFNGTSYPTPEQRQAIMTELSAAIGVS